MKKLIFIILSLFNLFSFGMEAQYLEASFDNDYLSDSYDDYSLSDYEQLNIEQLEFDFVASEFSFQNQEEENCPTENVENCEEIGLKDQSNLQGYYYVDEKNKDYKAIFTNDKYQLYIENGKCYERFKGKKNFRPIEPEKASSLLTKGQVNKVLALHAKRDNWKKAVESWYQKVIQFIKRIIQYAREYIKTVTNQNEVTLLNNEVDKLELTFQKFLDEDLEKNCIPISELDNTNLTEKQKILLDYIRQEYGAVTLIPSVFYTIIENPALTNFAYGLISLCGFEFAHYNQEKPQPSFSEFHETMDQMHRGSNQVLTAHSDPASSSPIHISIGIGAQIGRDRAVPVQLQRNEVTTYQVLQKIRLNKTIERNFKQQLEQILAQCKQIVKLGNVKDQLYLRLMPFQVEGLNQNENALLNREFDALTFRLQNLIFNQDGKFVGINDTNTQEKALFCIFRFLDVMNYTQYQEQFTDLMHVGRNLEYIHRACKGWRYFNSDTSRYDWAISHKVSDLSSKINSNLYNKMVDHCDTLCAKGQFEQAHALLQNVERGTRDYYNLKNLIAGHQLASANAAQTQSNNNNLQAAKPKHEYTTEEKLNWIKNQPDFKLLEQRLADFISQAKDQRFGIHPGNQIEAEKIYEFLKNNHSRIDTLFERLGLTPEMAAQFKNHLLFNEHLSSKNTAENFDLNQSVGEALLRLINDEAVKSDYVLIIHEIVESHLMNEFNLNSAQAHDLANQIANWENAAQILPQDSISKCDQVDSSHDNSGCGIKTNVELEDKGACSKPDIDLPKGICGTNETDDLQHDDVKLCTPDTNKDDVLEQRPPERTSSPQDPQRDPLRSPISLRENDDKGDEEKAPRFIKENKVPQDNETILKNDPSFKPTNRFNNKKRIFKRGKNYYHRDGLHTGHGAHLEVYDKRGNHIGKANPLTGEIIPDTAVQGRKIDI